MKRPRMMRDGLTLLFVLQAAACLAQENKPAAATHAPPSPSPSPASWSFEATPIWQDEFDYAGLPDPAKWSFQQGGDGWGNHELQYYTHSLKNARVGDGVLTIAARKQKIEGSNYSSARLRSKGKGDFLYGRFEVRAKLPTGRGTWPAIWMLPTDQVYGGWPKSGEIDIMEHVGYDPDNIHITTHTEAYNHRINTQRGATRVVEGARTGFHLYRVDWTPDAIHGYIDGQLVLDFPNEGSGHQVWPFDKPFHLLLNLAVGGDWGGKEGVDYRIFPATMQIDYVRVYRMVGAP